MASPPTERLYPSPEHADLASFIGQPLSALPTPAAILDRSIVEKNCARLLQATKALGVGFRPHVKTHKTTQVTRLQLGEGGNGKVVVSTVREAEALEDLVQEGLVHDILYGLPAPPSSIPRLAAIHSRHPGLKLSLLLDHPSQIESLTKLPNGPPWLVYVKLDMGYHRAGVEPASTQLPELVSAIVAAEAQGAVQLAGLYCHAGNSYSANDTASAFHYLAEELATAHAAAEQLPASTRSGKLTISVGATPTALVATAHAALSPSAAEVKARNLIGAIQGGDRFTLELHAGVYTLLDLQQLSTHVLPGTQALGFQDLAFTVLAEVISLYPGRGVDGSDEALVALGTTGLGREPGKDWPGWGAVSNWGMDEGTAGESGWIVGRISQEHGILTEYQPRGKKLKVGQKIRVVPQHACIAGSGHGWYFIVDGNDGDEVVRDVWVRWRGW